MYWSRTALKSAGEKNGEKGDQKHKHDGNTEGGQRRKTGSIARKKKRVDGDSLNAEVTHAEKDLRSFIHTFLTGGVEDIKNALLTVHVHLLTIAILERWIAVDERPRKR